MTELSQTDPERIERILAWAQADPALQRRFRSQLAERCGWSAQRCDRAISEYLRFCAVAAELGGRAVPSAAVDEVWHLHLTWTRDYWDDFCPRRLGFALHHQPATGGADERERLRLAYAETLHAYQRLFGTPDADWWPAFARVPARPARKRWARIAASLGLLPAASAVAFPGPLDWRGPEFLQLYLLLAAAALLFSLGWRLWQRHRPQVASSPQAQEPPIWQLAYLNGGPRGVVDSAAASLYESGLIGWDANRREITRLSQETPDDPMLRALLPHLAGPATRTGTAEKSSLIERIREQLVRLGWWLAPDAARHIAWISALPWWLLSALGVLKIGIGIARDRPVALLVLLVILSLVVALAFQFSRPGISAAGRRALAHFRGRHAVAARAPRAGQLGLAVALGGTAVLAATGFADYHTLRHPPSSGDASGDSSSSDGGSDGGGSGCGGCGGD